MVAGEGRKEKNGCKRYGRDETRTLSSWVDKGAEGEGRFIED